MSDANQADDRDGNDGKNVLKQRIADLHFDDLYSRGARWALVSDLWRHAQPSPQCDVILTLPANAQAQALAQWLVQLIRQKERGIRIEVRLHALTGMYALYLTAKYATILRGAEMLHMHKPVKPVLGGGMREFCVVEMDCFDGCMEKSSTFITQHERAVIVRTLLQMIRAPRGGLRLILTEDRVIADRPPSENVGDLKSTDDNVVNMREGQAIIPTLINSGHIEQMLTVHNEHELKMLNTDWVRAVSKRQPLNRIKDYFGTQIAVYFAWLGHYTGSLAIPAVFGTIIYYFDLLKLDNTDEKGHLLSDITFVIVALFNCVWSTIYLESWKRRQAELAYSWGTEATSDYLEEPRAAFKATSYEPSPITGRLEPACIGYHTHIQRWLVSAPLTLICITAMPIAMFIVFRLQDFCNVYFAQSTYFSWVSYLPLVLYALFILVSDMLYRDFAVWLNDRENYRTDNEYENSLVVKIVLYQCISAYGSMFYIAFYLKDIQRLRETLATLLISRQVIQNIVEVAIPWLTERAKINQLTMKLMSGMSDETLREHVTLRKQERKRNESLRLQDLSPANNFNEIESPIESGPESPIDDGHTRIFSDNVRSIRQRVRPEQFVSSDDDLTTSLLHRKKSTRLPMPEFKITSRTEITHAELECLMPKYRSPLEDYLEMCIQFGYVLLFSPAFPLASLCALMNNLFEIRVDAFKLCNNVQRPFGQRTPANIGSWQRAMEFIGVIGVLVNCALIGQSGLVQRLVPDADWSTHLFIVVVLEHIILAVKWCIDVAIPDEPKWVSVERAKMEYQRREEVKRDLSRHRRNPVVLNEDEHSTTNRYSPRRDEHPRHRSVTPASTVLRPSRNTIV